MGLRIQKRVRLGKGLTLKLSRPGASWTVGRVSQFPVRKGKRGPWNPGQGRSPTARS